MIATLIWGAPNWAWPAAIVAGVVALLVIWSYWRSAAKIPPRLVAATLKLVAVSALACCLLEPLFSGVRPRPGANLFLVMADNSRSLRVRDAGTRTTRGEVAKRELTAETSWQTRLGQDFDVRRYIYDRRLHPSEDFAEMEFDGARSALYSSLDSALARFHSRPNAGVLLFTDGRSTDIAGERIDWEQLPPVYPVVLGGEKPLPDILVRRLTVTQSNFEAAPVTIAAEIVAQELDGESVVVQLLDETGERIAAGNRDSRHGQSHCPTLSGASREAGCFFLSGPRVRGR